MGEKTIGLIYIELKGIREELQNICGILESNQEIADIDGITSHIEEQLSQVLGDRASEQK